MRSSKAAGKDAEEYEGQFLHRTIGGRIKSNSTKYGSHKLNRHYTASSLTPPSASSSSGSPGSSASAVSSYLENLPSISNVSAPPRPTRPPGGLLGISNGRGMGYGRTLGASYDSPVTTHGSFNGHVRSGANLYGGTQGSGLSPTKSGSSGHHHRPTLSVFPIQKAMEISLKEWKLLQAASNRGEASSLSTGPSSGMAFVRELRLRHARGVNITEHCDKEEDIIVRQFGDDTTEGNVAKMDSYSQGLNGSRIPETEDISKSFMATTRTVHEHGDIRIQRPAIASFDAKMQYPGIAHLPHSLTPQTSAVAVRLSPTKSVYPTGSAVHEVRKLLDSYPAPSPYCVDEKKRSPLHFAAASGDLELVEFLLERGVRPDCGRDIAGNMPLHLAIISNRIDVVAALLKAGADMTLASPMTLKTPLDLAESRLSYLLSRAQEASKPQHPDAIDLFNRQIATRSTQPPTQSSALLDQIKGIVSLLRPYVVRQQRLQHGERQKERQKERSWERADKYMRQQSNEGSECMWRTDGQSEDNYGDMEDEDDDDDGMMDVGSSHRKLTGLDHDGDMELIDELPPYSEKSRKARRIPRRMNANETEEALESLMNGLSLLEANRLQQQQLVSEGSMSRPQQASGYAGLHRGSSDIGDGNLADTELDRENEVDDGLPDLLEQVQQVLQAIKLNESSHV